MFLADDNLLVREGVRTLLAFETDLEVVGVAADYDELVAGAEATQPQVLVTDIRMPPTFQQEGIEAAKEVRKRHPGTGVVVLSQYDEPEYAIALLEQGAAGYAYLLKDRVSDGNRLAKAVREVATGGSMLDPEIVQALVSPVRTRASCPTRTTSSCATSPPGRPGQGDRREPPHHARDRSTPRSSRSSCSSRKGASAGRESALRRLRLLQKAIIDREEQGETLSRLLPGGLAEKLRDDRGAAERTERLVVTVLMSDVRGYSAIAESTDPTVLAGQLNAHRREMNAAILEQDGTVMQYVGDAVMAVFGAPFPQADHADRAFRAACGMHRRQAAINDRWAAEGLDAFGLGIGLSTGDVAAALLGSDERVEYTLVGDTVNLAQRLQDLARPAGTTVCSEATVARLTESVNSEPMGPTTVKGREGVLNPFRVKESSR